MFRAPAAPLVHRSKTTAEPWRKWCHFLRYGPNHDVLVLIGRGILTDAFRNGFACCVLIGRATAPRRGSFLAGTVHYTTEDTQVDLLMPIRFKFSDHGEHYSVVK